jgi:hypothetical protein
MRLRTGIMSLPAIPPDSQGRDELRVNDHGRVP